MALLLAGEAVQSVQGADSQGWVREITALDTLPGLKIDQQGTGRVFDFQDGGSSRMYLPDGGDVTLVGSLVFDLANDVTITPSNPSAPRTLTLPAVGQNSTFAFLQEPQTFTALQTLSGGVDLGSTGTLLNVGAAGNDFTSARIDYTGSGNFAYTRTTAATNSQDDIASLTFQSSGNAVDGFGGFLRFRQDDTGAVAIQGDIGFVRAGADQTTTFRLSTYNGGTRNPGAFEVTAGGELRADLDGTSGTYLTNGVNLVDEHDDAKELQSLAWIKAPWISLEQKQAALDRAERIGFIARRTGDGGLPTGQYHIRLQPMLWGLMGGIYQSRIRMDAHYAELDERLKSIGG